MAKRRNRFKRMRCVLAMMLSGVVLAFSMQGDAGGMLLLTCCSAAVALAVASLYWLWCDHVYPWPSRSSLSSFVVPVGQRLR